MPVLKLPRNLLIVIALALTLLPNGVGQAAPARGIWGVFLDTTMPESPLCADSYYPVTVQPMEQVVNGSPSLNSEPRPLPGVVIEATAQDTNVATFHPAKLVSGFDVDNPVLGAADFTLETNKAGTTKVWFEAKVRGQYLGPAYEITVVPCQYKVTMTFRAAGGTGDYDSRGSGKVEGEIAGDFSRSLKGTADQGYWDMHAFSPCCSHSITSNSPNAELSGSVSADGSTLSLHANFSPISATDTSKSRPIPIVGSVTGTSTANLQIPPLDVNLSASGDSKLQEISVPFGEISLQVWVVITVTPIPGQ